MRIERGTRVLGVFAHPDDETFFAGGTLAAAARAGAVVRLVTLTAGEAGTGLLGRVGSGGPATAEELERAARVRLASYASACAALGITDVGVAARGSSGAVGRWHDLAGARDPRRLTAAETEAVASVVRAALDAFEPDLVLTVGPDGVTSHGDHVKAHEAVAEAARSGPRSESGARALRVLGACVPRADLAVVLERLGGRYVGGTHGVPRGPAEVVRLEHSPADASARRAALAVYHPDLDIEAELRRRREPDEPIGDVEVLAALHHLVRPDHETFLPVP